ncbi:hypothetical protein JXQ70_15470 [bacterium]|nr:hypothetical protein [bacterium]
MRAFYNLLLMSQPLLLFVIIGIGYVVGKIKIKGFSLGIAGVLFTGLLFGMWREGEQNLKIAQQLSEVGLILFVYVIGLSSGPGFFNSFRKSGFRFNLAVLISLSCSAGLALILGTWLHLSVGLIAGAFCGALTNTPALAAATELIQKIQPALVSDPTVGYSMTYPFGVIGALITFQLFAYFNFLYGSLP